MNRRGKDKTAPEAGGGFEGRLAALLEAADELALCNSVDSLCRRAVELGQMRLGFERLGIWFLSEDAAFVVGSFGVDQGGRIHDERDRRLFVDRGSLMEQVLVHGKPYVLGTNTSLFDDRGKILGRGDHVIAAFSGGGEVIGCLAMDNLLRRKPITENECRLLALYASVLGHVCLQMKAGEEKEEAERIKSDFVDMVSHELNTPLTSLKESISLMLDGVVGESSDEQKELLDILRTSADKLAGLFADVLLFQRLETGAMEFHMQENDINEVVGEVCETAVRSAREKGLDFIIKPGANLPAVRFDRYRIKQVLESVIDNAVKFTHEGAIVVRTAKADNVIRVSVEDTGPGLREEDLRRVFDRFEQLTRGGYKESGSGLGLAISKEIIKKHGGRIWAESNPAGGAIFHFCLPEAECG